MAFGFSTVTSSNAAAGTTRDTASVTPSSNALMLLAITAFASGTVSPGTPSVTGCGLTWELIDKTDFDTSGSDRGSSFLFRAMGASPSTGAITIGTFGMSAACGWTLDQITGVYTGGGANGAGAIVQSKTAITSSATTSISTTFTSGITAGNITYAALGCQGASGGTYTKGATFTAILGSQNSRSYVGSATEYDDASPGTTIAMSWSASGRAGIVGIEIKPASTAQNIDVYQTTAEANTGQAIVATHRYAIGQASETDTGQTATPRHKYATGQTTAEVDTGTVIGARHKYAAGQAPDTETAQAVVARKPYPVGQVTAEVDTGQSIGRGYAVAQATASTEIGQALTRLHAYAAGQASDTEVGTIIESLAVRVIAQASETDTGQSVAWLRPTMLVDVGMAW